MNLKHPAAFAPFVSDKVTVYSATQTPGKVSRDETLFSCGCMIFEGAEISTGGPAAKSASGDVMQVIILSAEWKSPLAPVAGTTKIESPSRGMLFVQSVGRIGDDWALSCIRKAVRG